MRKLITILGVLVSALCSTSVFAQSVEVKGQVVDATGIPLIAVTVFEDGNTASGTMTDLDGNYVVKVSSSKASLVFSCLGFAEVKEVVGGRDVINVTLKEEQLSIDAAEVVSVGYGSVARRDLTGSVSKVDMGELFTKLYQKSLEGDIDCGGVTVYNYTSGEHITGFSEGRPIVARNPENAFTLANFLKAHLYSTLASLAAGMVILEKENVEIDRLMGHGGLFKTPVVGQKYLAAATNSPVWVMETAGEGGPYGIALLAAYLKNNETVLEDFLFNTVFADAPGSKLEPQSEDVAGFKTYLDRFLAGLKVEQAAIETL